MTSGISPRTWLAAALACLAGALAGCTNSTYLNRESYPPYVLYPERQDVLVVDKPTAETNHIDTPGQLDASIVKACAADEKAKALDLKGLKKEDAMALRHALEDVFGKPKYPRVAPTDRLPRGESLHDERAPAEFAEWQQRVLGKLQMNSMAPAIPDVFGRYETDESLERGSKLYRRHCMHCHGVPGDGRGPTAAWVNPHPRDYRQGLFKFMSTGLDVTPERKPRRADLVRTLHQGIDGTSMPAFGLLPEEELQHLISYVIHLSIRGQVEYTTMITQLDPKGAKDVLTTYEYEPKSGEDVIRQRVYAKTAELLVAWAKSNTAPAITPPPPEAGKEQSPDTIRKGHDLFIGKGICITCHSDYGRQANYRYDQWGTLVLPRNLTAGNYRGGRRPLDLYYRVSGGIEPSGMPAGEKSMTPEERWQVIAFVKALPYPAMLPPDVREKVYGASKAKSAEAE